jgi:hypothetical protein
MEQDRPTPEFELAFLHMVLSSDPHQPLRRMMRWQFKKGISDIHWQMEESHKQNAFEQPSSWWMFVFGECEVKMNNKSGSLDVPDTMCVHPQ